MDTPYDAVLVVSFGGPEGPDDVLPFLENVLRGRNVPRSRMLEVAQHYELFGGVSPINEQSRRLIAALESELARHGPRLPIYWGNRNWHPLLPDTLRTMTDDGVRRALAFVTSAFSSYSGCRQYLEDIQRARQQVGPAAPQVDKLRASFNHPGFIDTWTESLTNALNQISPERRAHAAIIFTAHSIPRGMADTCDYELQLGEACRLVSRACDVDRWQLVYQSRSGPPHQPWLEPDVCDFLRQQHERGELPCDVILLPIGFLSDHIEVLYDLDTEARAVCDELGIDLVRASTPGTHPRFVTMIRQLIIERIDPASERLALGELGPAGDECSSDCCRYAPSPPASQS